MRKKRKGKTALFIICSTIFLIAVIFFIAHSNFLEIKSIDVHIEKADCTDSDKVKNSSNILDQNIILINSSKIENEIKSKFVCVKDVTIQRNFPNIFLQNKIDLFLSGRIPKAILLLSKVNEATQSSLENIATPSAREGEIVNKFVVDEEGIVFAKESPSDGISDIPKIYYTNQDISLGQRANGEFLDALKILEKVKSFNFSFSESEISDGLFLIYPKDFGPRIVFKLGDDLDTKLASLQLILMQAKIDEKDLEFIDLRFDKPVVKFAPKRKNG